MSILTQPLSTVEPVFAKVEHRLKAQRLVTTTGPKPTNTFWTNLILNQGTDPIFINPYIVWYNANGFNINFSDLTAQRAFVVTSRVSNLAIQGNVRDFTVTKWDNLSVEVQSGAVTFYLVRGSPFITIRVANIAPRFTTQHAVSALTRVSANKYRVALNNGQTWLIYHEGSLNLANQNNQLVATAPYTGIARIILVNNRDANNGTITNIDPIVANLDNYANVYPIGSNISYTVTGDTASIVYDWQTARMNTAYTANNLLMLTLPHQRTLLTPSASTNLPSYRTIKGMQTPQIGTRWTLNMPLTKIDFESRLGVDPKYRAELIAGLTADSNRVPTHSDVYFYGKDTARIARLALIADELIQDENADKNLVDIRTKIINNLKTYITSWLNSDRFVYDTYWRGVITRTGFNDQNADFGNGWYNDHHFHYGYFFYTIAVIAKYDTAFFNTWSNQIMSLVRDVANPSTSDPHFPVTRNKDWYDGHSWANGLFSFGDSKNQESTSEAVNAYYGLYLLGLSTNNKVLADLGRVLLGTEILSSQFYWQVKDASIYPEPFASNRAVGVLWSTKVDYVTWFGPNVEFIHGIQMLPFTPISEDLLDPAWIRIQQPILETALTRATPRLEKSWEGFIYMSRAIINPESALAWVRTNGVNGVYDGGNSYTNTLYWIVTRPGLGVVRSGTGGPTDPTDPTDPDPTVLTIDSNSKIRTIILKAPVTVQIRSE